MGSGTEESWGTDGPLRRLQKDRKLTVIEKQETKNAAQRKDLLRLWLMISLTFATGLVDAVGYLGLDHVFTGNMTGNIVILAMALAGGDDLPLMGPLVALTGFIAGAAVAGLILAKGGSSWTGRTTGLMTTATLLLGAASIFAFVTGAEVSADAGVVLAGAMAFEMGIQACVARRLAVKEVTTVVVTSTLVSLAGDWFSSSGKGRILNRRLAAILVIFGGAVVGTLLLHLHIGLAVALAALITLCVTVKGHFSWNSHVTPL